jgi:hypothetical protein
VRSPRWWSPPADLPEWARPDPRIAADVLARDVLVLSERIEAAEEERSVRMKGAWALQDRVTMLEKALRVAAPYVYQTVPNVMTRQADARTVHDALGGDGNRELRANQRATPPKEGSDS